MERRKALTLSAAGAMLLASGAVALSGSWLQASETTAAAPTASTTWTVGAAVTTSTVAPLDPQIVTEVRDVYDMVVVPTTAAAAPVEASSAGAPPATTAPAPAITPTMAAPAPALAAAPAPTTSTTAPREWSESDEAESEDVEIPEGWPPGRPLPAMPQGCREPHLEDNGVWNCDH